MRFLLRLFARHPWVAGLFGLVISAGSAYLLVGFNKQLEATPKEPRVTTAADAIAHAHDEVNWVTLSDLKIDCAEAVRSDSSTYIPARAGADLVLTTHSTSSVDCESVAKKSLTGTLEESTPQLINTITRLGFDVAANASNRPVYSLCTTCGAGNTRIGVYLMLAFFIVGLSFYPLARAMKNGPYGR